MNRTKNRGLTGMPTVLVGALTTDGKSNHRLPGVGRLPKPRRRGRLQRRRRLGRLGRRRSRLGWSHIAKLAPYAGTAVTAASVAADLMSEYQTLKRNGNGRTGAT